MWKTRIFPLLNNTEYLLNHPAVVKTAGVFFAGGAAVYICVYNFFRLRGGFVGKIKGQKIKRGKLCFSVGKPYGHRVQHFGIGFPALYGKNYPFAVGYRTVAAALFAASAVFNGAAPVKHKRQLAVGYNTCRHG